MLEEYAETVWHSSSKSHYLEKGYVFTKFGDKFLVPIEDLSPSSSAELTKVCDDCGSMISKKQKFGAIMIQRKRTDGRDRCGSCGATWRHKTYKPNQGKSFSDVHPEIASLYHPTLNKRHIDYVSKSSGKIYYWICLKNPNHIYQMSACERARGKSQPLEFCPVCYDKKGNMNPNWKGGITTLSSHLRNLINQWKEDSVDACDSKCLLTGEDYDDIHHLYGFNLIVKESLCELDLSLKDNVSEYTSEEIIQLNTKFMEIHSRYPLGVCLRSDIHSLFHREYGNRDNTPEQFEEFSMKYRDGIYKEQILANEYTPKIKPPPKKRNLKLNIKQAGEIKYLLLHSILTLEEIGDIYGVCFQSISDIKIGLNWKEAYPIIPPNDIINKAKNIQANKYMNPELFLEIRSLLEQGKTNAEIAKLLNVKSKKISDVRLNKISKRYEKMLTLYLAAEGKSDQK
ncbi:zinc-ribbon domain-containing protein [Paenibacillus sp. JSM ZJ436]|uniref:zinc-ribbon domain-containing protein n=1 Tax=Paenibacillus sp. JSM ZJ436 TaxID=3376190 RepID=UPI00378FE992